MPFYHLELTAAKPRPDDYPDDPTTVGEHLRKARLDRNLLQEDVAERIGVHPDTVGNWEQGRAEPAIRHFPALIEFLGYVPFEIDDSLPERIHPYRKIHGLSKRRFAERLGVDESTVTGWEQGWHEPLSEHRERLESILSSLPT